MITTINEFKHLNENNEMKIKMIDKSITKLMDELMSLNMPSYDIQQDLNFLRELKAKLQAEDLHTKDSKYYFDLTPEQLKGNSKMKEYFIDALLSGPKKFSQLFTGAWQNASKFRYELEDDNIIVKDINGLYDFTQDYKNKHNLQ